MVFLREKELCQYMADFSKELKEIPGFSYTKLFMMLDETSRNYLIEENFNKFVKY